jgi:hypothetical protein
VATALTVLSILVAVGILIWGGPNALGIKRKKQVIENLRKRNLEAAGRSAPPDQDRPRV